MTGSFGLKIFHSRGHLEADRDLYKRALFQPSNLYADHSDDFELASLLKKVNQADLCQKPWTLLISLIPDESCFKSHSLKKFDYRCPICCYSNLHRVSEETAYILPGIQEPQAQALYYSV